METICQIHALNASLPSESTSLTKSTGGQVGFRANIDTSEKRKISLPCQALNHKSQVLKPTA